MATCVLQSEQFTFVVRQDNVRSCRLCFVNRCRYNNDVIIKKFLHVFKKKFPTKCIFRIFLDLENQQNNAVL